MIRNFSFIFFILRFIQHPSSKKKKKKSPYRCAQQVRKCQQTFTFIHSLVIYTTQRQEIQGCEGTEKMGRKENELEIVCVCTENQKKVWVVYQPDAVKNDTMCCKFSHHKPRQERAQVIKMQPSHGPQRDNILLRDPTLDHTASATHLQPCQLATGWQERVQLIKNLLMRVWLCLSLFHQSPLNNSF